jgi:hypothetical protein
MAGNNKPVRFILAWQTYSVGDVITPNGTHRDWLLDNGYVEPVDSVDRRPARMSNRAAAKVAAAGGRAIQAAKDLLPG